LQSYSKNKNSDAKVTKFHHSNSVELNSKKRYPVSQMTKYQTVYMSGIDTPAES